jgi:chromosome segregation ATPase
VGIGVVLFIKNIQLKNDNTGLETEIAKLEGREKAIKKKYSEEKAKATALQRAKMAADSKTRTLQTQIDEFEDEKARIQDEHNAAVVKLEKMIADAKSELAQLIESRDGLKARYDETSKKLKTANENIRSQKKELADRDDEIKSLNAEVDTALRKIDRVVNHNKALAELGEEVLAEFDDRNVFDSLLEKEPFTQAKRVALEQMIQEYLDRIDDDVLTGNEY